MHSYEAKSDHRVTVAGGNSLPLLGPKWTQLRYHKGQDELWRSDARFRMAFCGRRSGKSDLAKRWLARQATLFDAFHDGWFVFAAPTYLQAKRIAWRDLKELVPKWLWAHKPSESELIIRLKTGTEIQIIGMDSPERIEGRALDGIVLDEFANIKENTWKRHVRPALSTPGRPGWAWMIGVPEGRNHAYRMSKFAQDPKHKDWFFISWPSSDILDPKEILAAKEDLDDLTYQQEYEASFLNFSGRIYYSFDPDIHAQRLLHYHEKGQLIFCFDFNVSPGVAVVLQEQWKDFEEIVEQEDGTFDTEIVERIVTCCIGEIWIPNNSNTEIVCRALVEQYGDPKVTVKCYGDASGGARGTAKVRGSDWDIIREELKPHFKKVLFSVPKNNPPQKTRVVAMNTRLRNARGQINMLVDPHQCPRLIEDLEGVTNVEGGAFEIDKQSDPERTHLTDALGYYVVKAHPVRSGRLRIVSAT